VDEYLESTDSGVLFEVQLTFGDHRALTINKYLFWTTIPTHARNCNLELTSHT
jgi:hypothetical protein